MSLLLRIYKRNIYGVMGTLIFHILLVSAFILADVDIKGNAKEEPLIIEFPDLIPIPEEEISQEEESSSHTETNNTVPENTTNIASNRLSESESSTTSSDDFFDDEYMKELEAARNLASDVRNQLSKEIVDFEDIKMPVESTDGMNPDSIDNVVYVGESNIVYYLKDRYHVNLYVPVYLASGGGKVIVDISVNRQGKVVKAEPRKNRGIRDEQVFIYSKAAALQTTFDANSSAPAIQKGTIHYTFIAQ